MSLLTRKGYIIDKQEFTDEYKNELTVSPDVKLSSLNFISDSVPVFTIFEELCDDTIVVPRHWGEKHFGSATKLFGRTYNTPRMMFEGTLRSEIQHEAAETTIKQLRKVSGGVLSLPCGCGKTVVALHVACTLKLKTLVVVHKSFLMDQWTDRIKQFVPTARVGRLQQNTIDIRNTDIVVGMLQSIAMRVYNESTFDGLGLIIFDEVHVVPAPVFSRALLRLCAPYMLGLSATPERKDGLSRVISAFVGPVFYEHKLTNKNNVTVLNVLFDINTSGVAANTLKLFKPPINRGTMVAGTNLLCNMFKRNDLLVSIIKHLVVAGHKILLLSDRRAHCELLNNRLNSVGINGALYMGGMKAYELEQSKTKNVLLGTYSLAREGLDVPTLDALILATPRSDVVQACGRVLRETTKMSPVIVDVVDKWFIGTAQFRKRRIYYENAGFVVKDWK